MPERAILITGGAGFIGSHLVDYFRERAWRVIVLDRFDEFAVVRDLPADVALLWHDLRDPIRRVSEKMERLLARCEYVIHAAAGSHVDRSVVDPIGFVSDNVLGTVHLLEYVRSAMKPKKTLIFSTDEVFGPAGQGELFDEFARTAPANPYAASKAGADAVACSYANTYGIPIVISHCTNVFGLRQHKEKFIPLVIDKLQRGERLQIHGRNGVPSSRYYLHVADVCRAVELILQSGDTLSVGKRAGRYNISGQTEYSNVHVATEIALMLEKRLEFELIEEVKNRPAFDMRYAVSWDRLFDLGWTPRVSLEAGLRELCMEARKAA